MMKKHASFLSIALVLSIITVSSFAFAAYGSLGMTYTLLDSRLKPGQRLNNKPNELSGGEQQRVAIARALIGEPVLLLADEPTANLDSKTSEEIISLFRKLNAEHGETIFMVTHEPELGKRADRIIRLRDGVVEKEEKIRK